MSFIDFYELELAEVAAGQVIPIPLFPIGEFKSAKYPKLSLTQALADELIANFEAGILGTAPVLDSSGRHDTTTPAAGWFKRLHMAPLTNGGDMLFGDCELTSLGAELLNAGAYKYDSVEIDAVTQNDTGKVVPNVFKSATLTNTPVLRMLPPVLEAGDAIKVALSEVTAAEPDPVAALCGRIDALLVELSDTMKGKAGVPVMRTMLREVAAKAGVHNLNASEVNDGDPAEPTNADSESDSQAAKDDEGQNVTLAEGDAATKGSDHMKSVALKLNLAEDADEATIEAAVDKLTQEKTDAVDKLAESEKAKHDGEVEAKLEAAVTLCEITPGERIALAEKDDAVRDSFLEARKGMKAIELGESGSGKSGIDDESDDPTAELDKASTKMAEERSIPYGEAMALVLSEDPALAARYANREI
jgi:hypothetical protein